MDREIITTSTFEVRHQKDDIYAVVQITTSSMCLDDDKPISPDAFYEKHEDVVYQGDLSNCEAYIRLREGGYM
jgi:hypothetical protein